MAAARLFLRELTLLALVALFFLSIAIGKTYAYTNYPLNTNPDVPANHHTRVQVTVLEVIGSTMCLVAGYDPLNPSGQCLGPDPYTKKIGLLPQMHTDDGRLIPGGALGGVSTMIASLYAYPPTSGFEYTHYLASNFGLTKAYAAEESGYENLTIVRNLWLSFRNIAYVLLVIAFVIVGLAIMLRVRIDPRTVMTIQNQIPKIIIGIILITFSYAIAGFLIDFMWLTTYVGINTVASGVTDDKKREDFVRKPTATILNNPIAFVNEVFKTGEGSDEKGGIRNLTFGIGKALGNIITNMIFEIFGINPDPGGCGVTDPGGCVERAFRYVIKAIASLIIFFALLIALLRVFFMLLKAYAFIFLDVIVAPFWILAGLIPGSSLTFSSWFRHLLAHLLVFPATVVVIMLAKILVEAGRSEAGAAVDPAKTFVPPLIGNPNDTAYFLYLIAFAIILMLPELLTIIRDALRSKPTPYSGAIGAGAMAGAGSARSIAGTPLGAFRAYKGATGAVPSLAGGYEKRGWIRTLTKSG